MTNGTNRPQQDTTGDEGTRADAREFGQHVRQGGWRLGLLVARNVEKGKGHGGDRRSDQVPSRELDPASKVSALTFAELSGVGKNRVLRYLAAWNLAAEQGHVPAASTLSPGTDIDLNVDTLPDWRNFYEIINTDTRKRDPIPPSIEAIEQAVKTNPEIAKALSERIEPTPEQVTKAMRSNPEIEQAARDEAWEITRERATTPRAHTPSRDDQPQRRTVRDERADVVALASKVRAARLALDEAIEIAHRIDGAALNGLTDSIRARCDLLDAALSTGDFDAQLVALLESEAGQ